MNQRISSRSIAGLLVAGTIALAPALAGAAATPEQKCQSGRFKASATYASCHQKVLAKFHGGSLPDFDKFEAAMSKCRLKYQAAWPKLMAAAAGSGSSCDQARYADNGTTVTDNLSGLQWEKKTDDSTVHDKDNFYSWTAGTTEASGTVFTSFLAGLNSPTCFAGQCDWRLPTLAEVQSIVPEAYPCTVSPCIDAVFGPTVAGYYWSSTSSAGGPNGAWSVYFGDGVVDNLSKSNNLYVRGVRAGS